MVASADMLLDASTASWPDFVSSLEEALASGHLPGRFAYVRPPLRCTDEARRLVRALGCEDRVHILSGSESVADASQTVVPAAHGTRPRAWSTRGPMRPRWHRLWSAPS